MRVVFDTNVWVSAIIFPGRTAERALLRSIDGRDTLLYSRAILDELLGVLARKFARDREALARVAVFVADVGELVAPRRRIALVGDDADNRILECALEGDADLVVTGDRELLELGAVEAIEIVTLRSYLQR